MDGVCSRKKRNSKNWQREALSYVLVLYGMFGLQTMALSSFPSSLSNINFKELIIYNRLFVGLYCSTHLLVFYPLFKNLGPF